MSCATTDVGDVIAAGDIDRVVPKYDGGVAAVLVAASFAAASAAAAAVTSECKFVILTPRQWDLFRVV